MDKNGAKAILKKYGIHESELDKLFETFPESEIINYLLALERPDGMFEESAGDRVEHAVGTNGPEGMR